jgi:DnaK suppressor protein
MRQFAASGFQHSALQYVAAADASQTVANRTGAMLLPRNASKMLTPERIERLRGYLLEEQANLRQELTGLDNAVQEANIGLGNHMAEDATAAFDQATTVSLRRGHELALKEVERALRRIDGGTYGRCERCGEEIDFARLKAVPQTTLCMTCQRQAEL